MNLAPYTDEESARIEQHFVAAYTAIQSGEDTDTLGKYGLPQVYANLAAGLYHDMLEKHGIAIRGVDILMTGLTCGFALGRDFGRSESLDKIVEGVVSSE